MDAPKIAIAWSGAALWPSAARVEDGCRNQVQVGFVQAGEHVA
ncbi:hypothetical protein [Actinacidiphila soli]|nr:hypothetical protein [Actinacidiphila soli]